MDVDFTIAAHWSAFARAARLTLHQDSAHAGFTRERWIGTKEQAQTLIEILENYRSHARGTKKAAATRAIQRIKSTIDSL